MLVAALVSAISLSILMLLYCLNSTKSDGDFFAFYNAAQRSWHAETIYRLSEAEYYLRGETALYIPYIYAPHFLLMMVFMRGMDPQLAEFLWQVLHLGIWMGVALSPPVRRFLKDISASDPIRMRTLRLMIMLTLPQIMFIVIMGHPAVSAAGVLLLAMAWLEEKPVFSGLLFAWLGYKFQLILLVPVLLVFGRHGKALLGFCVGLLVLFLLGAAMLGWESWPHYGRMVMRHAEVMRMDMWRIIAPVSASIFVAARQLGASETTAFLLQGAGFICGVGGLLAAITHRRPVLVFVMFATGSLLVTPYCYRYDLMPVSMAIALLAMRDFTRPTGPRIWPVLWVYLTIAPLFYGLTQREIPAQAIIWVMVVWGLGVSWMWEDRGTRLPAGETIEPEGGN